MFLSRKFLRPDERRAADPRDDQRALPARVEDVARNLDLLMATRRGVGHVLPDFGFSQSGHWSAEGLITHYTAELRENAARYEPRLQILEVDGETDDDGRPLLVVEARVTEVEGLWRLVIDLVQGRVTSVDRAG